MKIEVLMSVMNQTDTSIVKKANIKSDVLIINQCDSEWYCEEEYEYGMIRMYSTTERGLSNSRNMAISKSNGEICLLCDDDVVYFDDYVKTVTDAYMKFPYADIIVFNNLIGNSEDKKYCNIKFSHKAGKFKSYNSTRITFRRNSFIKKEISFNPLLGSGAVYDCGEESYMILCARRKKLKIYEYAKIISTVYQEGHSHWFKGYGKKYFYNKGAYIQCAYPFTKHIYKYYFALWRLRKENELSAIEKIKYINHGLCGFNSNKSYEEYFLEKNKIGL